MSRWLLGWTLYVFLVTFRAASFLHYASHSAKCAGETPYVFSRMLKSETQEDRSQSIIFFRESMRLIVRKLLDRLLFAEQPRD